MKQFRYTALAPDGKKQKGKIVADTEEAVREMIKSDGLVPLSIKQQNTMNRDLHIPGHQRVNAKKLGRFCRQFSAIYNAGVPMVTTLELLRRQTSDKNLTSAIYQVMRAVESGMSLSDSMKREPDVFPQILCEMAMVGEQSGTLPTVLNRMAEYYEKTAETKSAVLKVMIYPAMVTLVVIAVLIVMMTQIVPRFEEIFSSSGSQMPGITRAVIGFCNFFSAHFFWFAALFVVLLAAAILFSRTTTGRYFFGLLARRIPLVKSFTEKNASAMLSRTLSLLLAAGISMMDALTISMVSVKNIYFKDAIEQTKGAILRGVSLSDALRSTAVFPPMMIQMTSIGENAGQLNEMLEKCAKYFDEETDVASQALLAALEPTIMIVLILVVAVIVFAIAIPMFSMYGNLLR